LWDAPPPLLLAASSALRVCPSPLGTLTCPASAAAALAEGARPAKAAGHDPGEILPLTMNMVLGQEGIFKHLLTECLVIRSWSRKR